MPRNPSLQSVRKRLQREDARHLPPRSTILHSSPWIGPPAESCMHCNAVLFHREHRTMCCASGTFTLAPLSMPTQLNDLILGRHEMSHHFSTFIRTYNNSFAFSTLGVRYDVSMCQNDKNLYIFRVNGTMHHFINSLIPNTHMHRHLQLYFYDPTIELQTRLENYPNLHEELVTLLISLSSLNPYATFFRQLYSMSCLDDYRIYLKTSNHLDQRVYNRPTVDDISIIWQDGQTQTPDIHRDIQVYPIGGSVKKVSYFSFAYDPLQYPLIHPYGQPGWHVGIVKKRGHSNNVAGTSAQSFYNEDLQSEYVVKKRRMDKGHVSIREYYSYRIQIRPSCPNVLLHTGRLLQQYVVDQYIKIETQRLDFYRSEQSQQNYRQETLQGILDAFNHQGIDDLSKIGKPTILPSTFIGGPRDMHQRYMDAMALVQTFGKPDFFITMTCNPQWPEIQSFLSNNESSTNRPDLVARVFRMKLEELKHELLKNYLLGKVQAYSYVVEFQKRGLPHIHMLLIMHPESKLQIPESYDKFISGELPDQNENPYLYNLVCTHMLHGPCGLLNPNNICMKDAKCKNHYPKQFVDHTVHAPNGYPKYRRRNNGATAYVRSRTLDNRWVVPYNPYLLSKFDCHINVEICSTIKLVKYLYKYVYKGHDRVAYSVGSSEQQQQIDEISAFQTGRWVAPPEACWRIFSFLLNEMHPAVIALQLHLPNYQYTTFKATDPINAITEATLPQRTMLTEFFRMNELNTVAKNLNLLYKEFPQHFVWDRQARCWRQRKKGTLIGRIVTAKPIEKERYFLRILLQFRRGPTSFKDLATVNGQLCETFRAACVALGLLDSDNAIIDCLNEASQFHLPSAFSQLFSTILVFCNPAEPQQLWTLFFQYCVNDTCSSSEVNNALIESRAAAAVNKYLAPLGNQIQDFGINNNNNYMHPNMHESVDYNYSLNTATASHLPSPDNLNLQQREIFDIVTTKIRNNNPFVCFIDGPAGTGKTYLYNAILAYTAASNILAIPVATSGVAASLLPNGQTAHSKFKLPLDISETKTCNIPKQSNLATHLRQATLIIWDEISMARRELIEALDATLQDITDSKIAFGGKVVVFGGDFRQITPVIPNATKDVYIEASCVSSTLFKNAHKFHLTMNMRARNDTSFSSFLETVGNNSCINNSNGEIKLPSNTLLPFEDEKLQSLIQKIFPSEVFLLESSQSFASRSILTTTNEIVDQINSIVVNKMPGDSTLLLGRDVTKDPSQQAHYEDYLATITPNGMPPHALILKEGAPLILLRNLDPTNGLSNGTRLICQKITHNLIEAEIITGPSAGTLCFIPRIPLQPKNLQESSVEFTRTQFPVKLCFAMTINKSQGQTLENVGLYIREPVFMHGQLYVALSRTKSSESLHIVLRPTPHNQTITEWTRNIVYQELLQLAGIDTS